VGLRRLISEQWHGELSGSHLNRQVSTEPRRHGLGEYGHLAGGANLALPRRMVNPRLGVRSRISRDHASAFALLLAVSLYSAQSARAQTRPADAAQPLRLYAQVDEGAGLWLNVRFAQTAGSATVMRIGGVSGRWAVAGQAQLLVGWGLRYGPPIYRAGAGVAVDALIGTSLRVGGSTTFNLVHWNNGNDDDTSWGVSPICFNVELMPHVSYDLVQWASGAIYAEGRVGVAVVDTPAGTRAEVLSSVALGYRFGPAPRRLPRSELLD
jgi:hypothetical protein